MGAIHHRPCWFVLDIRRDTPQWCLRLFLFFVFYSTATRRRLGSLLVCAFRLVSVYISLMLFDNAFSGSLSLSRLFSFASLFIIPTFFYFIVRSPGGLRTPRLLPGCFCMSRKSIDNEDIDTKTSFGKIFLFAVSIQTWKDDGKYNLYNIVMSDVNSLLYSWLQLKDSIMAKVFQARRNSTISVHGPLFARPSSFSIYILCLCVYKYLFIHICIYVCIVNKDTAKRARKNRRRRAQDTEIALGVHPMYT